MFEIDMSLKKSVRNRIEARVVGSNIEICYCCNSCLPAGRFGGYSVFLSEKLPARRLNFG